LCSCRMYRTRGLAVFEPLCPFVGQRLGASIPLGLIIIQCPTFGLVIGLLMFYVQPRCPVFIASLWKVRFSVSQCHWVKHYWPPGMQYTCTTRVDNQRSRVYRPQHVTKLCTFTIFNYGRQSHGPWLLLFNTYNNNRYLIKYSKLTKYNK